MGKGRIPACNVAPSDGKDITSGHAKNEREVKLLQASSQVSSGNKCGHSVKNHRFYLKPVQQKRRFHVLEESIRRIKKNLITPFSYPEFNQLLYKDSRKLRSEAREAELSLLLPAIADTVNLVRMELGYWEGNQFVNYNYRKYVELTGMSEIRVKRHMRALQQRGLIKVEVIPFAVNDGFKTEKVIITVSEKIFEILGLERQFLSDREKALRNRIKIENKEKAATKYLELYRAKKITTHNPRSIKDHIEKEIGKPLIKKIPQATKGHGQKIQNAIANLVSKGYSVKDAMEIVRKQYPPS